jgi:hypothetical protein
VDTSFKSLNQIVENISEQVQKINKGELNLPEIESLTSNAQELYERLVVIRYKAFEKIATQKPEILTVEDEGIIPVLEEKEEETFFDLSQEEDNTTNEAETEMLFDFSEPVEEINVKPVQEEQVMGTAPKSINEKFENKNSMNDVFKSATKNSLADKLKFTPIDNLKSHININQKFLFISKLFNGDNDAYNGSIEKLNNFSNSDEARMYLNELSQNQNWNAEDENVITLVELVERRYM